MRDKESRKKVRNISIVIHLNLTMYVLNVVLLSKQEHNAVMPVSATRMDLCTMQERTAGRDISHPNFIHAQKEVTYRYR